LTICHGLQRRAASRGDDSPLFWIPRLCTRRTSPDTFEAAHLAIGSKAAALTDYFDACRRKRNVIDYINSSVATETESEELLQKAQEFHVLVEQWIATKQPKFTP
jgi:hypothetical protein